jgi:hypothetical protein
VLLAGILIRLPFVAADQRVIADPELVLGWARHLAHGGLVELLHETTDVLYPPLAMLAIWFSGLVVTAIGGVAAFAEPAAVAAIKAWPIVADTALAWLVARLLTERGPVARIGGAASIALNPAFWYLATLWGQIDSVLVLLMVASVAALRGGHLRWAWGGWAAGVLWKVQALPLTPLVLVHALRTVGPRGAAAGAVAAAVLAVISGGLLLVAGGLNLYVGRLWPAGGTLDITAFNAWYLVTRTPPGAGDPAAAWLGGGAGGVIGFGVTGVTVLVVLAALWRRPAAVSLALCAAMTSLAAFDFLPGMRERYLLPVIPFLALAACGWEGRRFDGSAAMACLAITLTETVNLVAVGSFAPNLWTNVFAAGPTGPLGPGIAAAGSMAAVVNLIVLGWGLRRLVGQGWPRGTGLVMAGATTASPGCDRGP